MLLRRALVVALLLPAGCKKGDARDTSDSSDTTDWQEPEAGVTEVETRDGVTLEADYHPADAPGRPGVILLHMIPPQNDRTNWPDSFITRLVERNWAVLVPDRRGAGGSEGEPQDAYQGEKGKWDVEACIDLLASHRFGPVAIIGASNGTTSMIDYTTWAAGEERELPAGHGYMTGGAYTESQTAMEDVPVVPSIFTYQSTESSWSEAQQALDPGTWVFHEYPGAGHGTEVLTGDPQSAADLEAWLAGVLGG